MVGEEEFVVGRDMVSSVLECARSDPGGAVGVGGTNNINNNNHRDSSEQDSMNCPIDLDELVGGRRGGREDNDAVVGKDPDEQVLLENRSKISSASLGQPIGADSHHFRLHSSEQQARSLIHPSKFGSSATITYPFSPASATLMNSQYHSKGGMVTSKSMIEFVGMKNVDSPASPVYSYPLEQNGNSYPIANSKGSDGGSLKQRQMSKCTGCKSSENEAVAHCQDCADNLCSNCVTAHKFMNCFAGHKINRFDELDEKSLMKAAEDELIQSLDNLNECMSFMRRISESSPSALVHSSPPKRLAIQSLFNKVTGLLAEMERMKYFSHARNPIGQFSDDQNLHGNSAFRTPISRGFPGSIGTEVNNSPVGIKRDLFQSSKMLTNGSGGVSAVGNCAYSSPYNTYSDPSMLSSAGAYGGQQLHRPYPTYFDRMGRGVCEKWNNGGLDAFGTVGNGGLYSAYPRAPLNATDIAAAKMKSFTINSDDSGSTIPPYAPSPEQVLFELRKSSITGLVGHEAAAMIGITPPQSNIARQKIAYYRRVEMANFDIGTMEEPEYVEPSGVAVNEKNMEIIVADTHNHRIQVFNTDGTFKFSFGKCGKLDGHLLYPNRVAVDVNSGDIVITERSPTHQIQVFDQFGNYRHKFGEDILQHPRGVTVDYRSRIIVIECKVMRVLIFEKSGRLCNKFSCNEILQFPNGVCTNDHDEIFISDNRAHCIRVFNYSGVYLRQIGGEGFTNYPIGVAINHFGQVVVADNHNNFNVTVFTQEGDLVNALESKVKHAQCFDVSLMNDGSVVLASKDYRLYMYRYLHATPPPNHHAYPPPPTTTSNLQ